jgi:NADH:ubiquinone oxidoreductase subunit 3 (subunit A)
MTPLGILSIVIMAVGFAMVYASRFIVKKYGLDKKQKCEHESEMTAEEVEQYKFNKAVLNFKMLGMLVSIPGVVLFIINFK